MPIVIAFDKFLFIPLYNHSAVFYFIGKVGIHFARENADLVFKVRKTNINIAVIIE